MKAGNELQMEQFRQSLYDGVTEQVLCTLGLLKTVNGEKFRTVSYFLSLLHIRYHRRRFQSNIQGQPTYKILSIQLSSAVSRMLFISCYVDY